MCATRPGICSGLTERECQHRSAKRWLAGYLREWVLDNGTLRGITIAHFRPRRSRRWWIRRCSSRMRF